MLPTNRSSQTDALRSTSSTQTDPRQILILDLEQLLLDLNEIHNTEQFKETLNVRISKIVTDSQKFGLTNVQVMEAVRKFCANRSEP